MPVSRSSKVISLSLAQGIVAMSTIISAMFFTRYLSVLDYATYLQTFLAYDFFVPILTLGLPSALYYFLPSAGGESKGIVLDNIVLLFIAGMAFSLFMLFGGTELFAKRFDNPNLRQTLKWLTFYPLYTFPVVVSAVLVVQDRVRLNALYNVLTGITLMLSIIVSTILAQSYAAPILVRIIIPLFYFPIAVYLSFKYVDGKWRFPQISSMWRTLKFSIPIGFASVLGTLTLQLSNLIVSVLCSPKEYAIYANGAREIPVIGIITGSIAVISMAEMSQSCKKGNIMEALILFKKASLASASFIFPIFIFLLFFSKDFIRFFYTSAYDDSLFPFVIYLFFLPFRIVYWGSVFIALGRSKAILYRSMVELLLTGLLCVLFIQLFGYLGAALSPIIVIYFWSLPYNLISLSKQFKVKAIEILPFRELVKILTISLISGVVSVVFIFIDLLPILRLLIAGITFFSFYSILSYRYIPIVKEHIQSYIKRRS